MHDKPFVHRPPRTWRRFSIQVPQKHSETLGAFLSPLAEGGIEIRPGRHNAYPPRETIIFYTPASQGDETEAEVRRLLESFDRHGRTRARLAVETIVEEDWNENWKRHFTPIHLSKRLVVTPSWETYRPRGNELVIELDPGMAFGTGHHASTRLALGLLEEALAAEKAGFMLDVGTGTGILGMAGALLGAETVVAIDNDADARAAAENNIAANGLDDRVMVDDREINAVDGLFDLVAANITADVLTAIAPDLVRLTAPGGRLLLSGILRGGQEDALTALFASHGFTARENAVMDEWAAILLQRDRSAK